mmetsp:Transcript_26827/g.47410  ORF Transcript_26827/g.47410 Transcript_26827/m.47410 type:complete len:267 (+) Transcript_26827:174-974(+)
MHPVIQFKAPLDRVKVTLLDQYTKQVHWESAYKLYKPGVLNQEAEVIDGSVPAFSRLCPDDSMVHTYEFKATRYPPLDQSVNESEQENEIGTVTFRVWRERDPGGPKDMAHKATSALNVLSWPPSYPRPGVPTGVPRFRPDGTRARDQILNLPPFNGAVLSAFMDPRSRVRAHSQFLAPPAGSNVFHTMPTNPQDMWKLMQAAQAQRDAMVMKYLHLPVSPTSCLRTLALARLAYRNRNRAAEFFSPAPERREQDDATAAGVSASF